MEHQVPKHFIDFLESQGMSTVHIIITSVEMRKRGVAKWQDLVWSLLQELSLDLASNATSEEQFYRVQYSIYSEMLYLRRKYENKKANDIWSLLNINKARLASFSNLVMHVGLSGGDKRCKHSLSFEEKWFDMEEAIEGRILDLEKCSNPIGCTCTYIFQPQRDKEGQLARKN